MNTYWFFLPAAAATGLLAYHAVTQRSRAWATEFFLLAFVYFAVKENLSAYDFFHRYEVHLTSVFTVHRAHLGIIIGWLFTAYLSWTLAERILERFRAGSGQLFPTTFVAMILTASIAYPIEVLGVRSGWWEWVIDGVNWSNLGPSERAEFAQAFVGIPPTPLLGWPIFVGGFLWISAFARALLPDRLALRLVLFTVLSMLWFDAAHFLPHGEHLVLALLPGAFALLLLGSRLRVPESWTVRMTVPAAGTGGLLSRITEPATLASLTMVLVVGLAGIIRLQSPEIIITYLPFSLLYFLSISSLSRRRVLGWGLCVSACLLPFGPRKVLILLALGLLFFPVLGIRAGLFALADGARQLTRRFVRARQLTILR